MSELQFSGTLGLGGVVFHVQLSLVEFKEEDVTIIYSPALNVSGYGYTPDEAKQSFNITLHEFLRYTNNKDTFREILKELGWKIKGGKKSTQFNPPLNTDLIANNPFYGEIINSKNYRVYSQDVEFAL